MRVSNNSQQPFLPTSTPSHSRRTSFSEHVEELSFDNTLPVQESIESARIRHKIMKQPIIPEPIYKQSDYKYVPGKLKTIPGMKKLGNFLAIAGMVVSLTFMATGPIGIGVGLGLFAVGMIMSALSTRYVSGRYIHSDAINDKLINSILDADEQRQQICDVRHLNITDLPAGLETTSYIRYIIVNKKSAKYLPSNIQGIEIIAK